MIVGSKNINCIHTGKFACKSCATATKSTSKFRCASPEPPVRTANPPETPHGRAVTELVARRERLYIARAVTKTRNEVAGNTIPPLLCRALGSLARLFIFPFSKWKEPVGQCRPIPLRGETGLTARLRAPTGFPSPRDGLRVSDQYESSSKTVLFHVE